MQSSSRQDLTFYFSKYNTKYAEPLTVCSRSPAWQFVWPVPCPRRQSVSIRSLCWPDYLYVAQPPSEQLWPESHPGDSLLHSDGQRQKKSTWKRPLRWSRFIFSAAAEETDGAGADARWTKEWTSSQSAARMLLWLYSLTLLWWNCNFSQTHTHSLQQLSHSESLGHKSKWKSSLLVPWRSTVIVSLSGSLGRGNVSSLFPQGFWFKTWNSWRRDNPDFLCLKGHLSWEAATVSCQPETGLMSHWR